MVEKGHHIAFGRNSRMTDPAAGLVEDFSNRKFQAVTPANVAHYSQVDAVGRPIRPLNIFENFPGSAARQRCAGQRADIHPGSGAMTIERDGHFARR